MRSKNKKGISPLIATVLVIGFTIVLAALVITWGTKLFKTTVSETETAAKISLACTTGLKLDVDKNYNTAASPPTLTVTMRNNNQDQPINNFIVVLNYNDGTSKEGNIIGAGGSNNLDFPVSKIYTVTTTEGTLAGLKSVDIYPEFLIEGVPKSCENPENVELN